MKTEPFDAVKYLRRRDIPYLLEDALTEGPAYFWHTVKLALRVLFK